MPASLAHRLRVLRHLGQEQAANLPVASASRETRAARLLRLHEEALRRYGSYLAAPANTARARKAWVRHRDAERRFIAEIGRIEATDVA